MTLINYAEGTQKKMGDDKTGATAKVCTMGDKTSST
jgi:hypothetical protein|tara:strand:- start:32670 stop:32777 length:108 start_codon:yes stop_codon:yes gene_type:complete